MGTNGADGDAEQGDSWLIVVNYGSHALVERNFAGVTDEGAASVRLVVVDNYSSQTERSAMRTVCSRQGWSLVEMADNAGFAAACNVGVRAAREAGAQSVVLVNPDAEVTADVVIELARQARDEPATLVAPLILSSAGHPYFQGSRVDLRSGRMRGRRWGDEAAAPAYLKSEPPWRDWLTGACLAFSVELWERAGGLDERYFLYWEDVDFSQRCLQAGARLCLRRDLVVVHDEGATHGAQGSRARSSTYYFYNCRNRLLYAAAHLPRTQLVRWIVATPRESWQILLRGGRRQLLQSPRPGLATVRGSLAGLARTAPALLRPPRRG